MQDVTRLAVLADIHSNARALDACLAELEQRGAQGYVFLGDYVSDCPYPQRTMTLLRRTASRRPCCFIRGNREDYLLDHRKDKSNFWQASSVSGSLLYTYQRLTDADLDLFASCPVSQTLSFTGLPLITACHGSPHSTREHLFAGSTAAKKLLTELGTPWLLCGHTHQQQVYTVAGKTMVNPGAVGMAKGKGGEAHCALLIAEAGDWAPHLLSVPYDAAAEVADFIPSGLADMAGVWARGVRHMLLTGEDVLYACVEQAQRLYKADCPETSAPIPESYLQQAARDLGIPETF